jgi:hypothetical protein
MTVSYFLELNKKEIFANEIIFLTSIKSIISPIKAKKIFKFVDSRQKSKYACNAISMT